MRWKTKNRAIPKSMETYHMYMNIIEYTSVHICPAYVQHFSLLIQPSCGGASRTPDHQQGTLDVSQCTNNCVPGDRDTGLNRREVEITGVFFPVVLGHFWRSSFRHLGKPIQKKMVRVKIHSDGFSDILEETIGNYNLFQCLSCF